MLVSRSQQRIFHAEQSLKNGYNIHLLLSKVQLQIEQDKEIDLSRVTTSFRKLLLRHPILLSSFRYHQTKLICEYIDVLDSLDIPCVLYTSIDQILEHLLSLYHFTFDLKSPQVLFKIYLLQDNVTKNQTLCFFFHHILFDGWSENVFRNEFVSLYKGTSLTDLDYSYQDFCKWEQDYLDSSRFQRSLIGGRLKG